MTRPGRPESDFVFPGRNPRQPFNGLGGAWDRIIGRQYSPHGLRHGFASASDELGLSELTVATLLGHASARIATVTRGYISKRDALVLAAADDVAGHLWKLMTGETMSAEIVLLDRSA